MKKKNKTLGEALVVGSAIAGAALGAAAVFLSDKKNQDKIKKTVDEVSDEAVKIGKSVKKKVEELTNSKPEIVKKATTVKKVVKKEVPKSAEKVYTPKSK